MFISGIGLDSDLTRNESTCLALAQLFDWICGSGGSDEVSILFTNLFHFYF